MANYKFPLGRLNVGGVSVEVVYYVADTDAGKPVTGLNVGDLCYAKDTEVLFVADSATAWGSNITADYLNAYIAVITPRTLDGLRIRSLNNATSYASLWYAESVGVNASTQIADGAAGTMVTEESVISGSTIESGTYTPTLTNVTNLAASTAYQCQYLRVGRTVTVSGRVDVDPTLGLATELGISLPIASNIGAVEDCAGAAFATGIAGQGAGIRGDATNNRAAMAWVAADITNQPMYFTFTYQII